MLHIKFGFNWPSGFRGDDVYYGNIHVYCPGVGAYETLGSKFFSESLIFSPTANFLQDFHLKRHFSPFKCIGDVC